MMFYSGMRLGRAKDADSARRLLAGKAPAVVLVKSVDESAVSAQGAAEVARSGDLVVLANAAARMGN